MSRVFASYALVFILAISLLPSCQKRLKPINDGSIAFNLQRYGEAIPLLETEVRASKNRDEKIVKARQLAQSYQQLGFHDKAKNTSALLYQMTDRKEDLSFYIQTLITTDAIDSAIRFLSIYQRLAPDESFVTTKQIGVLVSLQEEKSRHDSLTALGRSKLNNLQSINTKNYEYGIAIHENQLFVSSDRQDVNSTHPFTSGGSSNVFSTTLNFSQPKLYAESWTSNASEDCPSFHPNDSLAVFTRCGIPEDGSLSSYCKLYLSSKDYMSWSTPEELVLFEDQDSINLGQGHWDAQGQFLYFVSDKPGGFGGRDIYRASYHNGEFGLPSNLGIKINSPLDDYFPNPQADGSLRFSTNGRIGYGGFDVYEAVPTARGFDEATLLPYPMNSSWDDLQIVSVYNTPQEISYGEVGEQHYIVSNRKGSIGKDDIFLFEQFYINQIQVHLTILEETEGEGIQDIEDYIPASNILLSYEVNNSSLFNDSIKHGPYISDVSRNSTYTFKVSKDGFFTARVEGNTHGVESLDEAYITLYDTIRLERIIEEKEIVIPNIYYAYDSASLLPESFPVLDTLILLFRDNPTLLFEIGSHTDSRGSDEYNLDLSQRRAQSVVDYFLSQGIPTNSLQPKGYGESMLLNPCDDGQPCSEEEHQLNRRTTFRVVGNTSLNIRQN
ncbi:MAG: OmpA family protein [Chitinophagales bacterium]